MVQPVRNLCGDARRSDGLLIGRKRKREEEKAREAQEQDAKNKNG